MNINKSDLMQSDDVMQSKNLVSILEKAKKWTGKFSLDKWEFDAAIREQAEADLKNGMSLDQAVLKYGDFYKEHKEVGENVLLNEGINELWQLVAGAGGTAYNNANARLGVGESTTAAAATQTALQGATLTFKAMDATYPTISAQTITFRATFASGDANIAWNEFTVDNGNTANKNLNRLVSAQGTKATGQTWQLTLTITLS